jgi:hypothetical protein
MYARVQDGSIKKDLKESVKTGQIDINPEEATRGTKAQGTGVSAGCNVCESVMRCIQVAA